jgi:hypothetical protein
MAADIRRDFENTCPNAVSAAPMRFQNNFDI